MSLARLLFPPLLGMALAAAADAPQAPPAPAPASNIRPLDPKPFERTPARIERGRYLAEGVTQCLLCHSERDWSQPGAPPAAGRKGAGAIAYKSDEQLIVAPNLTPDPETGAGLWPDDALARAIREGVGHDGRPLNGRMWFNAFRNLSDEDVRSIVVYLRTLPPVRNPLPVTSMPEKTRQRLASRLKPLTAPVPMPDQSTPLARGRYLAAIADCAGCHTSWEAPRNAGMYAGGNLIERGGRKAFSANLTPDPTGMPYDEATFVIFMRSGKFGTLDPIMPWVVFRNMSDADLRDLRTALRHVWPVRHRVNNSEPPTMCEICGQEHGGGDSNKLVPPQAVAIDPAELALYLGRYRALEDGEIFEVVRLGEGLGSKSDDGIVPMIPLGERVFAASDSVAPLRFVLDDKGRVVKAVEVGMDDYTFEKLP
jgi:mono/diheme cytochrome c family protein